MIIKENGKWCIQLYDFLGFFSDMPDNPRWYAEKQNVPYNPNELTPSNITTRSVSYNRTSASNYALAHWNSPNTNYPNYTNIGDGDCTNFVSQCLEAGGWQQVNNGSRGSVYSWYHVPNVGDDTQYRSTSWTSASALQNFLNNSDRVASNYASYPVSSYQIGDVIQTSQNGTTAGHSTMITNVANGIPYVTYRNGGTNSPQTDVRYSYLSGTKHFYKIANSY
jgi:hypothetical protein